MGEVARATVREFSSATVPPPTAFACGGSQNPQRCRFCQDAVSRVRLSESSDCRYWGFVLWKVAVPSYTVTTEVEAFLRCFHFFFAGDGRDKHSLAPNDGRGRATSRHFNFPRHVLVRAPAFGEMGIVRDTQRAEAAELRPIGGNLARRGARQSGENEC